MNHPLTAHKLASLLLAGPDVPVTINGWGSDEGLGPFAVSEVGKPEIEEYCAEGFNGKMSTGITISLLHS